MDVIKNHHHTYYLITSMIVSTVSHRTMAKAVCQHLMIWNQWPPIIMRWDTTPTTFFQRYRLAIFAYSHTSGSRDGKRNPRIPSFTKGGAGVVWQKGSTYLNISRYSKLIAYMNLTQRSDAFICLYTLFRPVCPALISRVARYTPSSELNIQAKIEHRII